MSYNFRFIEWMDQHIDPIQIVSEEFMKSCKEFITFACNQNSFKRGKHCYVHVHDVQTESNMMQERTVYRHLF